MMTVAWILKDKGRNVYSVLPTTPLNEAITILAKNRIGAVVVADEQHRVLGIISERDIIFRFWQRRAPAYWVNL